MAARLARFCAQRALQLAGTESASCPFILDTLAAVQSAAGEHKPALQTQQRAVQLLPADSKARPDMRRRRGCVSRRKRTGSRRHCQ